MKNSNHTNFPNNLFTQSISLFCLSFLTYHLSASNYYVSPSQGSNMNDGLSVSKPLQTIQSAVNLVTPGDTVFIMNGTYITTSGPILTLLPVHSGSVVGDITFKAYPGHTPKIKAYGNVWNAVSINASYIVIDGLELEGNNAKITYEEAYQSYQDYLNNIRDWSKIANFNTNGISIGGPRDESKLPHHVVIRNCKIHDFPGGGLSSIQADYTTFENNLVYNNSWYTQYAGSGISIYIPYDSNNSTSYRNIVRNNICHTNKTTIPWITGQKLSDGNGIIIDVNETGYSGGPTEGQSAYKGRTLVESNLCINNGGSGIHSYKADHVDIINNTAYHNGTIVGYPDIFTNNCNDVNIINNVMYSREGGQCNSKPRNITELYDYNIYFNGTVGQQGVHDITGDPTFVNVSIDRAVGDFHLKKNSIAIDSGNGSICAAKDIDGRPRPIGIAVDRGAYEYAPATFTGRLQVPGTLFHVYPNPALNWVSIAGKPDENITKVELFDLSGRLQLSEETRQKSEVVIGLGTLANGIYLMKTTIDSRNETVRIVKK